MSANITFDQLDTIKIWSLPIADGYVHSVGHKVLSEHRLYVYQRNGTPYRQVYDFATQTWCREQHILLGHWNKTCDTYVPFPDYNIVIELINESLAAGNLIVHNDDKDCSNHVITYWKNIHWSH